MAGVLVSYEALGLCPFPGLGIFGNHPSSPDVLELGEHPFLPPWPLKKASAGSESPPGPFPDGRWQGGGILGCLDSHCPAHVRCLVLKTTLGCGRGAVGTRGCSLTQALH